MGNPFWTNVLGRWKEILNFITKASTLLYTNSCKTSVSLKKNTYISINFLIDEHGQIVERAYNRLEKTLSTLPVRDVDKANKIINAISNFISEI